jgi:hypothetical protein
LALPSLFAPAAPNESAPANGHDHEEIDHARSSGGRADREAQESERQAEMTENDEFEFMRPMLDQTSLSRDDRNYMLSMLWTCDELPEIQSQEQFKEYGRLYDEANGACKRQGERRECLNSHDRQMGS